MKNYYIGVDIGGTYLKFGIVDNNRRIIHKRSLPADNNVDQKGIIRILLSGITSITSECKIRLDDIAGIGIGIPGTVNYRQGIVDSSPNFPKWYKFKIKEKLLEHFTIPVVVDNDAKMAAAGEKIIGAAKSYDNFILITIGTGIGGAIYAEGDFIRGRDGTAGEFGHIIIEPNGRKCGCGSRGCVEMYASARAIVRYYKAGSHNKSGNISAEDIYRKARSHDISALYAFKKMGMQLGIALTDVVNLLNPQAIIFTGKVSRAFRFFIPYAKQVVDERAFHLPSQGIIYRKGLLDDDAGIIGGVCMIDGFTT